MIEARRGNLSTGSQGRVLVVDDHGPARQSIADILGHVGYEVRCAASAVEALRLLDRHTVDVIITDLKMPGMDGLEFICRLEQQHIDAQIVMVTAHATIASAVEAMRHGAFDYIEKPFDVDQLEDLVARAIRHGALVGRRSSMPNSTGCDVAMVGDSPAMQDLREKIQQVAGTDETVLVIGESGTGKELVAKSIHAVSRRANGPLVSLNCPALSPQLMESELFGHERGAFTSADAPRIGRFELAEGGTILLDEVSEIDLSLQAKLLRVLQERSYERVGSSQSRKADVRVVATTNRQLQREVADGRFREDLYFRLAVIPIQVPALRERVEDIPDLAAYFLNQASERLGKAACGLEHDAEILLAQYPWPGNVRELENLMTRASVLCPDDMVTADQLLPWLFDGGPQSQNEMVTSTTIRPGMKIQDMERSLIETTLDEFNGHREKTARALGIGVRTLANKLKVYGYAPRTKEFASKERAEAA